MLTTLARLAIAAITLLAIPDLESALLGQLVLSLFVLWAFEWKREDAAAQVDLSTLARRGFLLGGVLLFVSLQAHIPRLALEKWHGPAELGAFATLAVLMQVGNLAASAFGQSLIPKLRVASGKEVLGFAALLFAPAALLVLLLLPLRQSVAGIILGADVQAAGDVLWLFSVAQMGSWPAAVVGCALTAKRIDRPQVWMAGTLCLLSMPLSYFVVGPWGASGAAAISAILAALTLGLGYAALRAEEEAA
jgi:O-antigen/teichoic acid export membrane protein